MTEKILTVVHEGQRHPWDGVYTVVFLSVIRFYVRSDGQIINTAVYFAIGIQLDGIRAVFGIWVGENVGTKFWLGIVNGLQNRGVEAILIACVDGLF